MSNPSMLTSQLASDLAYQDQAGAGTWTPVEPIRYDSGLYLEESGVNYHTNPELTSADTSWLKFSSTAGFTSGTRVTDQPDMGVAAWEFEILTVSPGASYITYAQEIASVAGLAGSIAPSVLVKANRAIPSVSITTRLYYSDASQENTTAVQTLPTTAERIAWPVATINAAKTLTRVACVIQPLWNNLVVGDKIWMSKAQIENKAYGTSYIYGGAGGGYAWTSTADASTSTRAASSASISPAGILAPGSGALAFRITPTIETGVEEIWGECGVKGSGTDHVQWGRDASKHPFVEWSSNDAAYQRLTASETWNALTAKTLYLGWNGTTAYLQVDSGTLQSASRDAVSGSWGAGNLKLQASKGGNIVAPFSAYSEHLNDTDRALVIAAIAAGGSNLATVLDDIAAPLRTMNIRTNALLRQ